MADNAKNVAASDGERDVEMEELRAELARLREAIAERAQDVRDAVAERTMVVRENPGLFSTALVVGGIVGFMVGMALGRSEPPRRWYERY